MLEAGILLARNRLYLREIIPHGNRPFATRTEGELDELLDYAAQLCGGNKPGEHQRQLWFWSKATAGESFGIRQKASKARTELDALRQQPWFPDHMREHPRSNAAKLGFCEIAVAFSESGPEAAAAKAEDFLQDQNGEFAVLKRGRARSIAEQLEPLKTRAALLR